MWTLTAGPRRLSRLADPRRDVVLLVAEHHLELADRLDAVGVRHDVALEVRRVVHARVDADRHLALVGRVAAALQALPADFEEHALLRVHELGLLRVDAEEGGVEVLDAVEHAAGAHVGRVGAQRGADAGVERGVVEEADGVAPGQQVVPELLDVGGAGKAPGHGDQRDGLLRVGGARRGGGRRSGRGHAAVLAARQLGRDGARGRVAEQQVGRQPPRAVFLQLGQHGQHAQRVAAQVEEVVVAPDPVELQRRGEGRAHALLDVAASFLVGCGQFRPLAARLGQGAAVELAVEGDRQLGQPDLRRRQHGLGQPRRQVRAQFTPRHLGAAGDQVGDQPQPAGGVGPRQYGARLDAVVRQQRRLDLAGLDAVAADLDLIVGTADEFESPVVAPAGAVAGAVEPLARVAERVRHEALGAQAGTVQVATRQPAPADAQLADQAGRQQLQSGAQHPQHGVVDGAADRHRARVGRQLARDAVGRGEGGAFGRAVAVDQRDAGQGRQRAPHVRHRERLAARQQLAQSGQLRRVVVDHGVEQPGRQPGGAHLVAGDGARQAGAGRHRLVVHHAAAAVEQRSPDFERRGVEAQRRRVQHGLSGGQLDVIGLDHQPQDGAVRDLDALGRAGRAGGVHDVGDGLAVDRCQGQRRQRGGLGPVVFGDFQHCKTVGHAGAVSRRHDDAADVCVRQHEADALGRKVGLHRQVGRAGLQDAEQHGDGGGAAVEDQTHAVARTHALRLQLSCDQVRSPVEFAVADVLVACDQRHGVPMAGDLAGEQCRHRERRVVGGERLAPER